MSEQGPYALLAQLRANLGDGSLPLVPPLFQTAAFAAGGADEFPGNATATAHPAFYTRYGNPTTRAFEDGVAALEGGQAAIAAASGMSALVGAQLGLGASSLSGLHDRMGRDGLFERQPDATDMRAWNIVLAEAGKVLRADAVRSARVLNDKLCDGFDDAELAIVDRRLEAVGAKFSKETTK